MDRDEHVSDIKRMNIKTTQWKHFLVSFLSIYLLKVDSALKVNI